MAAPPPPPPALRRQYTAIAAALTDLDRSVIQSRRNRDQFMTDLFRVIEDIYDDMIFSLADCETGRDVAAAIGPLQEIDRDLFDDIMRKLRQQTALNDNSYDFDARDIVNRITPILHRHRANLRNTVVSPRPVGPRISGPRLLPAVLPPDDDAFWYRGSRSSSGRSSSGRSSDDTDSDDLRQRERALARLTRRSRKFGSSGRLSSSGLSDLSETEDDDGYTSSGSPRPLPLPLRRPGPGTGGWLIKTKSKSQVKNKSRKDKLRVRSKKQSKNRSKNKPKLSFNV